MNDQEAEPRPPERLSYKPLMALQSRMLLAASDLPKNIGVIDPANRSVPKFTKDGLTNFEKHDYSLFNNASSKERRRQAGVKREELDAKVTEWANVCVGLLKNDPRAENLSRLLGGDPKSVNTESMVKFYNHYFTGDNKTSDLKRFVADAVNRYVTDDKVDVEALRHDLGSIEWFAHVFGTNSAEIVTQLIDAEVQLLTSPQTFVEQANQNRNVLTPDDDRLLTFLWDNRPTVQPTPEPSPKPVKPKPTGPVPPVEPGKPDKPAEKPTPLEAGKTYSLTDIFRMVKDPVPTNHDYFVENPLLDLPLTQQQLESLKTKEPFFVDWGKDMIAANPRVIPWDKFENDPRFNNTEALTEKDSGTLALAAVSSGTPEKQAALYRTMANAVLDFHSQNQPWLNEWLQAQKAQIPNKPRGTAPIIFFVRNDLERDRQQKNPEQRLLSYDSKGRVDETKFHELWWQRLGELKQIFSQPNPQLQPHHIRWLEFLSHSIKVGDLLKLIKSQQPASPKPADTSPDVARLWEQVPKPPHPVKIKEGKVEKDEKEQVARELAEVHLLWGTKEHPLVTENRWADGRQEKVRVHRPERPYHIPAFIYFDEDVSPEQRAFIQRSLPEIFKQLSVPNQMVAFAGESGAKLTSNATRRQRTGDRLQFDSDHIIRTMTTDSSQIDRPHHSIVFTNKDLYSQNTNFVVGAALPDLGTVISLTRIWNGVRDQKLRDEVIRTEIAHEIGHVYNLPSTRRGTDKLEQSLGNHCRSEGCCMKQGLNVPGDFINITRNRLNFLNDQFYCGECKRDLAAKFQRTEKDDVPAGTHK
ncbi:hypothetical protein HY612_04460 [Candidatus Roizmanbacteria bacterium]|nr:hypothetical protein [Candidatus Roizmanbacteria bacterium]